MARGGSRQANLAATIFCWTCLTMQHLAIQNTCNRKLALEGDRIELFAIQTDGFDF